MREFACETKQCVEGPGLELASVRVSDKPVENKLLCARSRLINSLCPSGTVFWSAQLTFTTEVLLYWACRELFWVTQVLAQCPPCQWGIPGKGSCCCCCLWPSTSRSSLVSLFCAACFTRNYKSEKCTSPSEQRMGGYCEFWIPVGFCSAVQAKNAVSNTQKPFPSLFSQGSGAELPHLRLQKFKAWHWPLEMWP